MDPNATLRDLLDALKRRDWDQVHEFSQALLGWMAKGGFPPLTIGSEELGKQWHAMFATCVCHAAQGRLSAAQKRRDRKRRKLD
jgi:hypothetical protein